MGIPFATHRVWVVSAPFKASEHGNRSRGARDWDNQTVVAADVPVCKQPDAATMGSSLATTEREAGGREMVTETAMFHMDPDVPIESVHGIRVGSPTGLLYLVKGHPQPMPDPLGGGIDHLAVKAERVRG